MLRGVLPGRYRRRRSITVLPSGLEAAQFLERWPSPYVFSVPNGGIYHIDYTGDVTAFSAEGDYGFQLLGTGSRARSAIRTSRSSSRSSFYNRASCYST